MTDYFTVIDQFFRAQQSLLLEIALTVFDFALSCKFRFIAISSFAIID